MQDDPRRIEAEAIPIEQIAALLELTELKRAGREMIGPCPQCGGEDRFGINLNKGVFLCRRCGAKGGGISLAMFVRGCSFLEALDWLCGPRREISPEEREKRARMAAENKRRSEATAAKMRAQSIEAARQIWQQGAQADASPLRDYLERRGLTRALLPDLPRCLRYHPSLAFTVRADRGWREIHRGPAMLAAIQAPSGRFSGVHRTWLDLDQENGKARILDPETGAAQPAKKVLGSKKGGAIRLSHAHHIRPCLVMGEGIETTLSALAAGAYPGATFWAGVDLGNMAGARKLGPGMQFAGIPDLSDAEAFVPPIGVEELIYLQDGDSEPRLTRAKLEAGLRRAIALRPGLRGRIAAAPSGADFNDILRKGVEI